VLLATVDDVLAAVAELVVAVFFVLVAMVSSTCSKSDEDETADIDKVDLHSGSKTLGSHPIGRSEEEFQRILDLILCRPMQRHKKRALEPLAKSLEIA
jgi:hypothetical protein